MLCTTPDMILSVNRCDQLIITVICIFHYNGVLYLCMLQIN